MADMIQIHSDVTIRVTAGLQNKDVTNPDAHVPDRLKVNPLWPKHMVIIRKGEGLYPKEIAEWPAVKALANDKVITIGKESTTSDEELDDKQKADVDAAKAAQEEFKMNDADSGRRRRRGQNLNDIADGVSGDEK